MKVRIEHHKTFIEDWGSDSDKDKILKHLKLVYTRREGKRLIYDHTHNLYCKDDCSFPTGYLHQLANELEKYSIDIDAIDNRAYPKGSVHLGFEKITDKVIEDREIQKKTLEKIKDNPVGMIIGAPGTGKSRVIELIVDHYRVLTLVVVPTQKIQQQMYDLFCEKYGSLRVSRVFKGASPFDDKTLKKKLKSTNKYRPKSVDINSDVIDDGLTPEQKYLNEKGFEVINGKMVKVRSAEGGKSANDIKKKYPAILVICFNSLPNLPLEYLNAVQLLVVDEGHTARNDTIQSAALEMKNAAYRYFVSATNWADIKEDMKKLISITGSTIIHEELPDDSIESGIIKKPSMRTVHTKNTDFSRKFLKGDSLIKLGLVGNNERNSQICDLTQELFESEGRRIMICVWEDSHAMILQERFRERGIAALTYFSKLDKKEKENTDQIVSNSKDPFIVICTIALGIGADTRSVDTIVLADVRKASISLLQRIGRGGRVSDEITDLWVYDFKDGFNDTTFKWHKERQKIFNDYYLKDQSFTLKKANSFGIKLTKIED